MIIAAVRSQFALGSRSVEIFSKKMFVALGLRALRSCFAFRRRVDNDTFQALGSALNNLESGEQMGKAVTFNFQRFAKCGWQFFRRFSGGDQRLPRFKGGFKIETIKFS
jgi:hypothetical protein